MKAQSTIFPCPDEKYSVKVSDTQAYWVRFIDNEVAVVRLIQKPVAIENQEGDRLFEYDELEIKMITKNLEYLGKEFGKIWEKYKTKDETVHNPVEKVDARMEKSKVPVSLFDDEKP